LLCANFGQKGGAGVPECSKYLIRGFSAQQAGAADRDESEKKERSDGKKGKK